MKFKSIMNHSLKISLMALVAMFAFNTTADAQFGGLLKKAKQAVSSKPKESAFDKRKREEREKNYLRYGNVQFRRISRLPIFILK